MFPKQIQDFATDYFAAEARAEVQHNGGKFFRSIDQKALALRVKQLVEAGEAESLTQLSRDLSAIEGQGEQDYGRHAYRLRQFCTRSNIKIPHGNTGNRNHIKHTPSLATTTATVVTGNFDLKAALLGNFKAAMAAGLPFNVVREQTNFALGEQQVQINVDTATSKLQALMKETGLSAAQLTKIAGTL